MTKVIARYIPVRLQGVDAHHTELQLIVKGHANYARLGEDLVCSAVSMLVQSFAAFLAGIAQDYLYDFSVDGIDGSGCVEITAIPTKQGWLFIYGAFDMATTGFYLLSRNYPKHVSFQINSNLEEE